MSLSVENVFNAINKNKKGLEINIVQTFIFKTLNHYKLKNQ